MMDIAAMMLFSVCALGFVGTHLRRYSPAGPLRTKLMAQMFSVALFAALHLGEMYGRRLGWIVDRSLLTVVADLALGVAALLGISIVRYITAARWPAGFYLLALLTLAPRYGSAIAGVFWLLPPILLVGPTLRAVPPDLNIKLNTLLLGATAGGMLAAATRLLHHAETGLMAFEVYGPVVAVLFTYAGLNIHRDPENEIRYPEVRDFLRVGLFVVLVLALLPAAVLPAALFATLKQFLVAGAIVTACFFMALLVGHFQSASIRTFLVLVMLALVPNAIVHLYADRWSSAPLEPGVLRLFSRTVLVLACLFILKQYLRWGFSMIQSMVTFITAAASAAIAFAVMYVLQPAPGLKPIGEELMMHQAVRLLDAVVLVSLPPVLVNYNHGTMKATWALFTIGIFCEAYVDFLPAAGPRYERDCLLVLAYGIIALAFATLWRYTGAMMVDVKRYARDDFDRH